jgi:hypothetical protein
VSVKTTIALTMILVATAFAHGRMTDRWGVPASVSQAAVQLNRLPVEIMGWGSTSREISARLLTAASAENIIDREYQSPDGDRVRVMLVCGRPGPVSRHPPTVCFTSSGLKQTSAVSVVEVPAGGDRSAARFSHCLFGADETRSQISTLWSFTANGRDWPLPDNPRLAFAGQGWLVKLYVIADKTDEEDILAERNKFTAQLLTELQTILL